MISVFLREQKCYARKELMDLFECSENQLDLIVRKLKEFGIVKFVRLSRAQCNMSELVDETIEVGFLNVIQSTYSMLRSP